MAKYSATIGLQWGSRHHRKGLVLRELGKGEALAALSLRRLVQPNNLNWWIGFLFAVGASLFAWGSLLSLYPGFAKGMAFTSAQIGAVFFAGSIPFSVAAYLQLWQSSNAVSGSAAATPVRKYLFGWRPRDIGWLSCAIQFFGTLLFNLNTFDAMWVDTNWIEEDVMVWVPNFFGSVAFLVSGYLAFIEYCHRFWRWQPSSVSWWLVFANLMGCVAFMVSALTSIVLPGLNSASLLAISLWGTLMGSICFLFGALLSLVEAAQSDPKVQNTINSDIRS